MTGQVNLANPCTEASRQQRIQSLDVLRGLAVLAILAVNIQSFALPTAGYLNPYTMSSDPSTTNLMAWVLSHLFIQFKFITLFSILFGVGLVLFSERCNSHGLDATKFHRRRMYGLLLIALFHAYLFWDGDILFTYALCGLFLHRFREQTPNRLWHKAIIMLLMWTLITGLSLLSLLLLPEIELKEALQEWQPSISAIMEEVAIRNGSWLANFQRRSQDALFMQTLGFILGSFWFCSSFMLMGMALYKQGFFIRTVDRQTLKVSALLWLIGFICLLVSTLINIGNHWHWHTAISLPLLVGTLTAPLMTYGYMVWTRWSLQRRPHSGLMLRLAAAGRMAFTNYLSQTLLCTTLFYGHGLAWFGQLQHWQLFFVVFVIWLLQLWWSPLWLRHFQQGPMEMLWRRMTYGRGND